MPVQRRDSSKTSKILLKSRYFMKCPKAEAQPQALSRTDTFNHHQESCKAVKATISLIAPTHHIFYPLTSDQRNVYRTPTGKALTKHQWDVYDFVKTIPTSKVTTYKDVSLAVGGSPRSVGSALKNNPFSPYIPCHRVIASDHFIGGFFGEWGKDHKSGKRCNEKIGILAQEGVRFNGTGYLMLPEESLWRPSGVNSNP